jgi:general secretion pathway protein G
MIARKGFTLVEVLLVVVIIAVLASIVIPRIASSAHEANVAKCDANRANLISALERYAIANKGTYPASNDAFQTAIVGTEAAPTTYFPYGPPLCPLAGGTYVYVGGVTGGTITAHSH